MLKLRKVAVTGGVASGKSTVTGFFQKFGAYIVSADQIVHKLLSSHTDQILSIVGNEVLTDGCIDRKKVADAVFRKPKLLKELEAFLHPLVQTEVEKAWLDACRAEKYSLFVAEVPLLFEAGLEGFYDATIAVISPEETSKVRFPLGDEEYYRRSNMQFTQAQKAKNATFIIENTGSLDELEAQVASLYQLLLKGENLDV